MSVTDSVSQTAGEALAASFVVLPAATVPENRGEEHSRRPLRLPKPRRDARREAVLRRAFDIALGTMLLVAAAPLWLIALAAYLGGNPLLSARPRVGQRRRLFRMLVVSRATRAGRLLHRMRLAAFTRAIDLLRGNMSLVGPQALSPRQARRLSSIQRRRFRVRPGAVNLHAVRRAANIDYATEPETELEYLAARSLKGDLLLVLRAAWNGLLPTGSGNCPARWHLARIPLDNPTMDEALDDVIAAALEPLSNTPPRQVCFTNADCVRLAARDENYRRVLCNAWRNFPDGIGVKLAARLWKVRVRQNICGTDFFPRLCARLESTSAGIFLLGARPGVAEEVARWVAEHYPECQVKGVQHGYYSPEDEREVIERIRDSGAEILLVAFGAPRQDLWVAEHLAATGVRVGMGVGGLFDFYSGRVLRAPQWVRELSLEWAYRVYQEPRRLWRRYVLGGPVFLTRVALWRVREVFTSRDSPEPWA